MLSRVPGVRILLAVLLVLGLAGGAAAAEGEPRYQDATPSGVPPGFEPVDVSEDVQRIEERREREMLRQVDADLDYRYATPERRIRARYGGATWNMYDPFH